MEKSPIIVTTGSLIDCRQDLESKIRLAVHKGRLRLDQSIEDHLGAICLQKTKEPMPVYRSELVLISPCEFVSSDDADFTLYSVDRDPGLKYVENQKWYRGELASLMDFNTQFSFDSYRHTVVAPGSTISIDGEMWCPVIQKGVLKLTKISDLRVENCFLYQRQFKFPTE